MFGGSEGKKKIACDSVSKRILEMTSRMFCEVKFVPTN
jgi:hypothetical protein